MSPPYQARATLRLSLGGGFRHRLATLTLAAVAMDRGWTVEDTTRWRGGAAIPDLVISREDVRREGPHRRAVRSTYWLEVVDTHDPRKQWATLGYSFTDVLTMDVSGRDERDFAALARGVVP